MLPAIGHWKMAMLSKATTHILNALSSHLLAMRSLPFFKDSNIISTMPAAVLSKDIRCVAFYSVSAFFLLMFLL